MSLIDLSQVAGFEVALDPHGLELRFGEGITSDPPQVRRKADIRQMLLDPQAEGPDHLYTIYMHIRLGRVAALEERGLGLGAVVYAAGTVGRERVRSQGHVHSCPPGTELAYSEVYEFWYGSGLMYLQDVASPEVSRVLLVPVGPGDKVPIPPGWVHVVVNTGEEPLVLGAVYALETRLLYEPLRELGGTAYYVLADGGLERNPRYRRVPEPRRVSVPRGRQACLEPDLPMVRALMEDPSCYDYVSRPQEHRALWDWLLGEWGG